MKENQTIVQFLNIKEFPFEIRDKNGNLIYYELSDNYWEKYEYDSDGHEIYWEDSNGLTFISAPIDSTKIVEFIC